VLITSNAEKELPDAFLRRCIFHYIDFPAPEKMAEIVRVHFPKVEDKLLQEAMAVFYEIREMREVQKLPATSELLDYIKALTLSGIEAQRIKKELPFVGVLMKKDKDIASVKEHRRRGY
jgi:MoxR-like ATPase